MYQGNPHGKSLAGERGGCIHRVLVDLIVCADVDKKNSNMFIIRCVNNAQTIVHRKSSLICRISLKLMVP
jgi:hypothetical protein